MAKKRKNKFSKTKQRPKTKIREAVNYAKARLGQRAMLTPAMASNYLNTFSDAANAGNIATGSVTSTALSGGSSVMFFSKPNPAAGAGAKKRVMHVNFTRATPNGDTSMNDSLRATIEQDGEPPAEIAVSAKLTDAQAAKSQLEQMIADMNEEARGDATKLQYRLEQLTVTPVNIRSGILTKQQVNIQFRLAPVAVGAPPALSPVMSSADLREGLGKDDKITGSSQYTALLDALDSYHALLAKATANKDSSVLQSATVGDVEKAALLAAIDNYLDKHHKNKDIKRNAAQRLREQLNTGNPFAAARQNALATLNPLDVATAGPGQVLGVGSKGPILSKVFNVVRPGFPANFEAAVKMDSTQATQEAVKMGIENGNPQESRRAVSVFEADRLLNLGVIPATAFVTQTAPNGNIHFGQAMQVVHGTDGQIKLRVSEVPAAELQGFQGLTDDDLGQDIETERDADDRITRAWRTQRKVVNVDYNNRQLQKGLSDLQMLDNIIGAADRHAGNFVIETSGPPAHTITGVKGIDNDDAFGKDWKVNVPLNNNTSKTPDVPPLVDVDTAIRVLGVDEGQFRTALNKLPPEEVDAAVARLNHVKAEIVERVRNGAIASSNANLSLKQSLDLAANAGIALAHPPVRWGTPAAAAVHTENNSYLGNMLARQQVQGNTPPVYK